MPVSTDWIDVQYVFQVFQKYIPVLSFHRERLEISGRYYREVGKFLTWHYLFVSLIVWLKQNSQLSEGLPGGYWDRHSPGTR